MRGPSPGHTHVKGNIFRLGGLLCMVFETSALDVGLGTCFSTSVPSMLTGFPGPNGKADIFLSGLQNSKAVLVKQGIEPRPLLHAYLLPTLHYESMP
ncbi:hypothetical protein VNO77_19059 [Canavalia gladiata]|uniref:Uncharacterized protein n=1 Tax=Canavalia gladiata TaxID=3824 RepID=A0AAN9QK65_CANGL